MDITDPASNMLVGTCWLYRLYFNARYPKDKIAKRTRPVRFSVVPRYRQRHATCKIYIFHIPIYLGATWMNESSAFTLQLIGPFGFFTPEGVRIEVRSKKAIALMALLALAPSGVRTRNWLQAKLWGTRDTQQAQSSLRRELSTLAKLLVQHQGAHLLRRESQRVQLCLDKIEVDLHFIGITIGNQFTSNGAEFLEGIDLPDSEDFEAWLRDQRTRVEELLQLNIPEPIVSSFNVHDVLGEPLPPSGNLIQTSDLAVPTKPSVTVLPFSNLGEQNETTFMGESVATVISMTLTQFPQLFIVDSNAAAVLVSRQLTPREIAQKLGVRYILFGSIRRSGRKIAISAQLVDGVSMQQLWNRTVEGDIDQIYDLEVEIATLAAPQIWTYIDIAERHRGLVHPIAERTSYELYWRANALFREWKKEDTLQAIELTDELVSLNPACALSASLAAFCNGIAFASNWTIDALATRRQAMNHLQNALRHGYNNVEAIGYAAGTIVSIRGDIPWASKLINHALSLLPAYQPTLFWGGWVDVSMGNSQQARERFELSLRINPVSGVKGYAMTGIGISYLMEGNAKAAFPLLHFAAIELAEYPVTQAALAVAAMMVGEREIARKAAEQLNQIGGIEPVLTILQNADHKSMLKAGLAMAMH